MTSPQPHSACYTDPITCDVVSFDLFGEMKSLKLNDDVELPSPSRSCVCGLNRSSRSASQSRHGYASRPDATSVSPRNSIQISE